MLLFESLYILGLRSLMTASETASGRRWMILVVELYLICTPVGPGIIDQKGHLFLHSRLLSRSTAISPALSS
ncbi:uncharacterized protein B0T15DRAFT_524679 [Chaetomium strumarium]|uniref:Uncharacterized protein n=1 Tax=Chaetomium strumarium TaxID=1170767 RepID=A0AAJ0GZC8_9PEZI|nr:hypothetical protein B0T15DRAFT_524679 [Chaetomium strumarium]